ncbi:MAG: hypothetical protein J7M03_02025 [Candidatus Desulfofervidaceae bacterium]|nr:hypothetical protein [Candidatus Desulfofervidaceae bacterium]
MSSGGSSNAYQNINDQRSRDLSDNYNNQNSQNASSNYSGFSNTNESNFNDAFSNSENQAISAPQQGALTGNWANAQNYLNSNTPGQMQFVGQGNAGQAVEAEAAKNNQRWNTNEANKAWNNQLQGGAYAGMGLQDTFNNSMQNSLNNPSNVQAINASIMGGSGNNYADAMKSRYVNDANIAQQNMMGNMDARAAASGMSGGSAHGNAIGRGMEGINNRLQDNMAKVGYETFDRNLDRNLGIAAQADAGTLARQNMMSGMIGNQQQGMQGAINQTGNMQQNAMSPYNTSGNFTDTALGRSQNAGQQGMSWLNNLIGQPTVLSSSQESGLSTGSESGSGSGGGGGSSSGSSTGESGGSRDATSYVSDRGYGWGDSSNKSMGGGIK